MEYFIQFNVTYLYFSASWQTVIKRSNSRNSEKFQISNTKCFVLLNESNISDAFRSILISKLLFDSLYFQVSVWKISLPHRTMECRMYSCAGCIHSKATWRFRRTPFPSYNLFIQKTFNNNSVNDFLFFTFRLSILPVTWSFAKVTKLYVF